MVTKKELEARFEISINTVRETLKACGLDTAKEDYTEEEITNYFQEARRLKQEEGLSYAAIAEAFGVTQDDNQQRSSPSASDFSKLIEDDVREEAFDAFRKAATNVMRQGYEQLPRFLLEARQALVQSGEAEEAIRRGVASYQNNYEQGESNGGLSPRRIEQLPSDDDELSM